MRHTRTRAVKSAHARRSPVGVRHSPVLGRTVVTVEPDEAPPVEVLPLIPPVEDVLSPSPAVVDEPLELPVLASPEEPVEAELVVVLPVSELGPLRSPVERSSPQLCVAKPVFSALQGCFGRIACP
jgi:hypothetical protein